MAGRCRLLRFLDLVPFAARLVPGLCSRRSGRLNRYRLLLLLLLLLPLLL